MNKEMVKYINNVKELISEILSNYVNENISINEKLTMQYLKSINTNNFLVSLSGNDYFDIIFPSHIFICCLNEKYEDSEYSKIRQYLKDKLEANALDSFFENNKNIRIFSIKDKIIKLTYSINSFGEDADGTNISIENCVFVKPITTQVITYV